MALKTFLLGSGATLEVGPANFEEGVALMEAVGKAVLGQDQELPLAQVVLFNPEVRKAIYNVFPWVIYNKIKVTPALFNDPSLGERACSDWFEMASKIVEVNQEHFFPRTSSGSLIPEGALSKSRE